MRIYESADEYFELDGNAILYRCKNGKIREYGAIPSLTVWNMRSVKPLPETCSVEEKFSEQIYEQEYISEVLRKWLMIFQEYGTNGCVINLETGEKYLFERENYCAETSCFSAFFEYEGHICLLHATK